MIWIILTLAAVLALWLIVGSIYVLITFSRIKETRQPRWYDWIIVAPLVPITGIIRKVSR